MSIKERKNYTDLPKAEVGEIDTRAPFESVKAAVSLFDEAAFSGSGEKLATKISRPHLTERVLAKETQLHLVQKEQKKFKEQLMNAGTTKTQAIAELEKAKRTVDELTNKLRTINESKESAIKATEATKYQLKQLEGANFGSGTESCGAWKHELDNAREQYTVAISELNASKQELVKIRQDFESSMEAKIAAIQQTAEAEHSAKVNTERTDEVSKEISFAEKLLIELKLSSVQAQQEKTKIISEKDVQWQSFRAATLKEAEKTLASFKREYDHELTLNLEVKLAETATENGVLQKQMENVRASDLDSVKGVTLELGEAKEALHKVAEEESSLRSLVESLTLELEIVKKEHSELKEKEAETESIAGKLHVKLRKSKAELEVALAGESKARGGASDEVIATLEQLSLESENARLKAEQMNENAQQLKKEAKVTRIALEEAEKKLKVALNEAEEAKAAEAQALKQIKDLSERTNAARSSTSESGAKIAISEEEFKLLNRKVGESEAVAEMKVDSAMAQVEAVKASENEAQKKLETSWKEIKEMKSATEEALKRAKMAEAAKMAIEGELRRWREREQKRLAEAAARILGETEMRSESSPRHATISPPQKKKKKKKKIGSNRKMEKGYGSKEVVLPRLSCIFHRKKNKVESGYQSYLPGEKSM